MTNIKTLTIELINHLEELKKKYELNECPNANREFFNKVKKESEPIFNKLEKWELAAYKYLEDHESLLYPQQITSTKENMEAFILHSYYIDVRKRRYMEMYKSCHYIFSKLLKEIYDE